MPGEGGLPLLDPAGRHLHLLLGLHRLPEVWSMFQVILSRYNDTHVPILLVQWPGRPLCGHLSATGGDARRGDGRDDEGGNILHLHRDDHPGQRLHPGHPATAGGQTGGQVLSSTMASTISASPFPQFSTGPRSTLTVSSTAAATVPASRPSTARATPSWSRRPAVRGTPCGRRPGGRRRPASSTPATSSP